MSLDATRWAWTRRGLKPSDKLILLSLADRADEHNIAYPSNARLVFDTELDRKTVLASLKRLEAGGFIGDTGKRAGKTRSVKIWKLIGVSLREKQSQKRDSSESAPAQPSENAGPEGCTSKQSQKRDRSTGGAESCPYTGTASTKKQAEAVPFFPPSGPNNGTTKRSQKRDTESTNRNLSRTGGGERAPLSGNSMAKPSPSLPGDNHAKRILEAADTELQRIRAGR